MSQYTVRPMRPADIESIIEIDAQVTGQSGPERAGFWRGLLSMSTPDAGGGSGLEGPEGEADRAGAAGAVTAAPHLCDVAEVAAGPGSPARRQVVGFVIGDVQSWQFGIPRHGRIVAIGVDPGHRRHGVASRLVDSLMASFHKMGLPFVHCLARPGDPLGDFFRAEGFRESDLRLLERAAAPDERPARRDGESR